MNSEAEWEAGRLAVRSARRNIASAIIARHPVAMRRFLIFSSCLALSACAARPEQPAATPVAPPAIQPQTADRSGLFGLNAQELVGRFGTPALQIREGNSLKLQFRGPRCVLDAYLYPSGASGVLKVSHIDTRLPSGGEIDQAACIFALRRTGI